MSPDRCPSESALHAFQLGNLPEPSLSEVAAHLESCPKCEARAQRLDTHVDPVLSAIRKNEAVIQDTLMGDNAPLPAPKPPTSRTPAVKGQVQVSYTFLSPPVKSGDLGRLGNYRVLRLLGKGGMGYVFHAEDMTLARGVALKVMKPEIGQDGESGQRFLREARLMSSLKHEHLVTVYQVGQEGSAVYLAMELLEGESLADRLKRSPRLEPDRIVRLACEMTSALAVIHGRGLIHRDVKPANIWLEAPGERIKILDFGLARRLQEEVHLTQTGMVVGTPTFMSPEQARGEHVDARSDLFSLGAVLYGMCTGMEPFRGPNVTAVLTALAVESPRPVHELSNAIPRPLSDLVMQLLSKQPERRPPSADAVLERLRLMDGSPSQTRAVPLSRPEWAQSARTLARRYWLAGLAALMGIFVVSVAWGIVRGFSKPAIPTVASVDTRRVTPTSAAQPMPARAFLSEWKPIASMNWPLPLTPDGGKIPNPFTTITVNSKVSPHGIGMHPSFDGPASVSYSLGKQYQTFQAEVSINDSSPGTDSPMTFILYGDGHPLWKSKPVETADDTQECKMSVKDVDVLKLEITGRKKVHGAHGVWLEPTVSK
ncbi:MAG: protein kinase [Gemmataceae bacterium]|nr:protein kinase [Gemmataceae bacterium]